MSKFLLIAGALGAALLGAAATALAQPAPGQASIEGASDERLVAMPIFAAKDQSERRAFEAALKMSDAAARRAAFEAFLTAFPQSSARWNALLQILGADAELKDLTHLQATAQRALEAFPRNVRVLMAVVAIERRAAAHATDPAATVTLAHAAAAAAEDGLADLRLPTMTRQPDGMSDAEFKALPVDAGAVFERALGYSALVDKDYARARLHLAKAIALRPDDWTTLEQMAAADLLSQPLDADGFWYAAKAIALTKASHDEASAAAIERFALAAYVRYHGDKDGWDRILAGAAVESAPPQGFGAAVGHVLSPEEAAVQAVAEGDPHKLAFGDWEIILSFRDASPANRAAADKVWSAIQDLQQHGAANLKLPIKVISATSTTIAAAVGDDARASNTADLLVTLEAPVATPPKPGDELMVSGILVDYAPQPFVFKMARAHLAK